MYEWAKNNSLVAHALGGINHKAYTNSLEAFNYSYSIGYKVFEVDLNLTSDGHLAAIHNWKGKPLKLNEFKKQKIFKKYTPLSFEDILLLMDKNEDVYLVTDTKETEKEKVKKQFTIIVNAAKNVDRKLLSRIIPQIYYEEMFYTVKKIYNFKSWIYTLYKTISPNEKVIKFAEKKGIKAIGMPTYRYDKEFVKELASKGIFSYVYTINSLDKFHRYRKNGLTGVYSDYILPKDV